MLFFELNNWVLISAEEWSFLCQDYGTVNSQSVIFVCLPLFIKNLSV